MSGEAPVGERQPPSSEMLRLIRDTLMQPVPARPKRIEIDGTVRQRLSGPFAKPPKANAAKVASQEV